MSGRKGRIITLGNRDRNATYKPWETLQPVPMTADEGQKGVIATYENNKCRVQIKQTETEAFRDQMGNPSKLTHLIVGWKKGVRGSDNEMYAMKKSLKGELCHPDAEAVELLPGEWREIDFGETHLWVLPLGASFPIGMIPPDLEERMAKTAKRAPVTAEELEIYVIENEGVTEVFADKEEAAKMYSEAGADMPEGYVSRLGEIPVEGENIGWTDGAKLKSANLMSKMQGSALAKEGDPLEVYHDAETIEDNLVQVDEDGPRTVEDGISMARAMEDGMKAKQRGREAMVKESVEIASEASDYVAKQKAAAADLAKMRENLVKTGNIDGIVSSPDDGKS